MTLTLMSFEPDGTIHFSGLHQDIIVYRGLTKTLELVETMGMWLGLLDDIQGMNTVDSFHLDPGDTMLLFTDGIVEAIDKDGTMDGDRRLQEVFETCGDQSTGEIRDRIIKSLEGYAADDDVTMMVVKRDGQ